MLSGTSVSRIIQRCSHSKSRCFKLIYKPQNSLHRSNIQSFSTKTPQRFWKSQPTETKSIEPWRILVGGAAVAGLAGTCIYGVASPAKTGTLSSALERQLVWPSYVADRIHSTYAYMLGSVGIASATAVSLLRSPAFMRVVTKGGWAVPIGMFIATAGSQIACSAMEYPADGSKLNAKHAMWAVFAGCMGAMASPIILLAGEQAIITQACAYTGAIVASLSGVAAVAPSDRFLSWAGPLSIGFGVIFIASLGSAFMSPASRVGFGLYQLSVYGGLALFSGFLLYDTQALVKRAEQHPPPEFAVKPFDPIRNSIGLTVDMFNIFVRVVSILSGNRKK